jgi:flagellar basal-body rod protein FlgC
MTGIEKLFTGMDVAASGMRAERFRIDVIAENLANARTTRMPEGGPYQRQLVRFEPLLRTDRRGLTYAAGVKAVEAVPDTETSGARIREPGHPDADAEGWVTYPNVNTTREMADLITAMRSYEANLAAQESFSRMADRALQLLV